MARRACVGLIAGALVLTALQSAWAQGLTPPGLQSITPYTGLLLPFANRLPSIPSNWISPYSVLYYPVPQPVYVPVPVVPERPAVESVRVAMVTLRSGAALGDLRVKPDTVVAWVNAENRELTLLVEAARPPTTGTASSRHSGLVRPNGTFSLTFHQPGVYEYFLQAQPDRRARVIVEE